MAKLGSAVPPPRPLGGSSPPSDRPGSSSRRSSAASSSNRPPALVVIAMAVNALFSLGLLLIFSGSIIFLSLHNVSLFDLRTNCCLLFLLKMLINLLINSLY